MATSRKSPKSLETTTNPQIPIHHRREDPYETSSRLFSLIFQRSGTLKTCSDLKSLQTRIGLERNAASRTTNSLAHPITWVTTIQTTWIQVTIGQTTSRRLEHLRTEANRKTPIPLIFPTQTIAQTRTRRHRAVILSQIPILAGQQPVQTRAFRN